MVFAQYILHNLAQVHPFPVTSEAVDHTAERANAHMGVFGLLRGKVHTDQDVGEGLTVVAVVVVEEKLGFRQNVCFSCNLIAGVECALRPWDFVAEENCKMKMKVNKRL